ncbi:MAG: hypothetical protein J6A50_06500 [Clostridia bacterium]|nr:hypothetical protein [Clostridia bacterium]
MKKTKNRFWKIYAAALGGLTFLMAVLLIIGYNIMIDYDKSQGYIQEAVAEIAGRFEKGDVELLFENADGDNAAMVFEKDSYIEKINAMIEEDGVTYRKGFSSDRYTRPLYDIFAGETKIASVQMVKSDKKSKFGFDTFEVESVIPKYSGQYAVSVIVPSGAELFLGDNKPVSDDFIEESGAETVVSNQLFAEGDYKETKYKVEGLLNATEPKVVYSKSGAEAELAYDEEKNVWYCVKEEIEITAPSNSKVFVNGVEISAEERFVNQKGIEISELKASFDETNKTVITSVRYKVSGIEMLSSLEVSAKAYNGSALEVLKNEKTGVYEVQYLGGAENLDSFGVSKDYLITCAEDYAKFVCGKGSLETLLAHVLTGTAVYDDFKGFWVTFSRHDSFWIENQTITELDFYTEDLFSATVSMDYWIKGFDGRPAATKCYPTTVTFFYAKTDSGLKIVDWYLG